MLGWRLVGSESDEGEQYASQILWADQNVEVEKFAALEHLNQALKHGGPGVQYLQPLCQAESNRVEFGRKSLALHYNDILLEAGNLQVSGFAQLVCHLRENLLKCAALKHVENLFTEADCAHECLLGISLLQAFHDLWHKRRHACLENLRVIGLQTLEDQELFVDDSHELVLVSKLANVVQAALYEDCCDVAQRGKALIWLLEE